MARSAASRSSAGAGKSLRAGGFELRGISADESREAENANMRLIPLTFELNRREPRSIGKLRRK
jgi:hypothetical protein